MAAGEQERNILLFVENPGAGKSTFINSLIGEKVARAGVNAGVGLTPFFTTYEHDGIHYLDTPGLADMKLRVQAAIEIEKALRQNGNYRIFFVLTLEAGRVRPEDVVSINTIMAAVNLPEPKFNVIVNKLTKREKSELLDDAQKMAAVYAEINSGDYKTDSIWYALRDSRIDDGDTDLVTITPDLHTFLYESSLAITILEADIGKIEVDQFEKLKKEYDASLGKLRKEIEDGDQKYDGLVEKMKKLKKKLKDAQDARTNATPEGPSTETRVEVIERTVETTTTFMCSLQ